MRVMSDSTVTKEDVTNIKNDIEKISKNSKRNIIGASILAATALAISIATNILVIIKL